MCGLRPFFSAGLKKPNTPKLVLTITLPVACPNCLKFPCNNVFGIDRKELCDNFHTCDENNCKLFIIKQNRFNVPVLKLREAIESNRFGKLVLGTVRVRWARHQSYYDQDSWRGTWALDGGVINQQAIHHVDVINWLMGPITELCSTAGNRLNRLEAEDTLVSILKFSNGAFGTIEATTAARPIDYEASLSVVLLPLASSLLILLL